MKPRIQTQLPPNLERYFPYSPQRANYCLRLGSAPLEEALEHCSAPW
jgi:hypothetical protein